MSCRAGARGSGPWTGKSPSQAKFIEPRQFADSKYYRCHKPDSVLHNLPEAGRLEGRAAEMVQKEPVPTLSAEELDGLRAHYGGREAEGHAGDDQDPAEGEVE